MKNTTPTIYGDLLQGCSFANKPLEIMDNMTLNQRLGIIPNARPPVGVLPKVGYIVIGNQGHRSVINGNSSWNTGRQHLPTNGGPFEMMPFVARRLDQDLSPTEMAKYGLRKVVNSYNGVPHAVYYARVVDMSTVVPAAVEITRNGTIESFRPFVPTSSDLSPTPNDMAPEETITTDGTQVAVRMVIPIRLTAVEIAEIVNACRVLYDNAERAVLSEISLVAAHPYTTEGTGAGGQMIQYTELAIAISVSHLVTHYQLTMVNNTVEENMVVGTSNPSRR